MPDEIGMTTRDRITLGQPHPAEQKLSPADHESHTQQLGNRFLAAGATIAGLTLLICLVALALDPSALDVRPTHHMFAVLAVVAAIGTSAAMVGIGGVERITRPLRAANRRLLAAADKQAAELADIRKAISVVAEHLPGALELADWRGYNQAMREGFAPTGTAGSPPAKRLGLVPTQNP